MIEISRVALALARARLIGARFPYYLPYDSPADHRKESELRNCNLPMKTEKSNKIKEAPRFGGNVRHGFVYRRVPYITLKSITNNKEIDEIGKRKKRRFVPLQRRWFDLISAETVLEEWEVSREKPKEWPIDTEPVLARFWKERLARKKIDVSKADYEYLYDKPYEDKNIVRVSGSFTVESLLTHRMILSNEDGGFVTLC